MLSGFRTDAAGDRLTVTTNLPSNAAFTVMVTGVPRALPAAAAFGTIISLEDAGISNGGIQIHDTGQLTIWHAGVDHFGSTLRTGQPHNFVFRSDGAALELLLDAKPDISMAWATWTIARFSLGDYGGTDFWNGVLANCKAWDAALSRGEIQREMSSEAPLRRANLSRWIRTRPSARGKDYSGNQRDLTEGGTLQDDSVPRIWILPAPRRKIVQATSNKTLAAASGSYTITGTTAALVTTRILTASGGSYAITGTATTLKKGFYLGAASGSYVISGTAAGLLKTSILGAGSGTYLISGTAAGLTRGLRLTAVPGSYAITGTAAGLTRTAILAAAPGAYAIAGTAASLVYTTANKVLPAAPGVYVLTGSNAALLYTPLTPTPAVANTGGGGLIYVDRRDLEIAEQEMERAIARHLPRPKPQAPTPAPAVPAIEPAPVPVAPAFDATAAAIVEGERELRGQVREVLAKVQQDVARRDRDIAARVEEAQLERAMARTEAARAIAEADVEAATRARVAIDAAKDHARHEALKAALLMAVMLAEDD